MIPADLSPLANHLWQSTLFVLAVWVLTLALRKNRAAVRYWLWLAASVKFLIPFSLLVRAGAMVKWHAAAVSGPVRFPLVMGQISQPFDTAAPVILPAVAAPAPNLAAAILLGIWLCGIGVGIIFWMRWQRRISVILRGAAPLDLKLPIPVMSSPGRLEPGVVGIRNPVLLLPDGITDRLTPAQLEAVLAHELRHVYRRDNLTAAIHMVVEVIFWFHPLVWWIRRQLFAERERACDEEVVQAAGDPQVYAEGILNVCKFYVESPVCVSGVTGADLKKRIEQIMARRVGHNLALGKKLLLAAVGIAAVGGPVVIGLANIPGSRAQSPSQASLSFDVATVKPAILPKPDGQGRIITPGPSGGPGTNDPGRIRYPYISLKNLLVSAYGVKSLQIQGPPWLETERFELNATMPPQTTREQFRAMLQNLLVEQFKLQIHRETKDLPIYSLVVARNGPKMKESEPAKDDAGVAPSSPFPDEPKIGPDGFPVLAPAAGAHGGLISMVMPGRARLVGRQQTMLDLANRLTAQLSRPVSDATGLRAKYDFTLTFSPEGMNPPMGPAGGPGVMVRVPPPSSGAGGGAAPEGLPEPDTPPDIFRALREQLGLALESKKGPVELIVIDHAEKLPTGN